MPDRAWKLLMHFERRWSKKIFANPKKNNSGNYDYRSDLLWGNKNAVWTYAMRPKIGIGEVYLASWKSCWWYFFFFWIEVTFTLVNGVSESLECNAMLLNIPPTDGFVQEGVYTLLQQYLFFAYIICRDYFQKTEKCPLSFFRKRNHWKF